MKNKEIIATVREIQALNAQLAAQRLRIRELKIEVEAAQACATALQNELWPLQDRLQQGYEASV